MFIYKCMTIIIFKSIEDKMKKVVKIKNKDIAVSVTKNAERELARRNKPLHAEMELYFSCLIRMKVRFYEQATQQESTIVSDKLLINFRPVMTAKCDTQYDGSEPPLTDFPIKKPEAFVPKWLKVDYKNGNWVGAFGMTNAAD